MTTYKLDLIDDKLVVSDGTREHYAIREFETAMLYNDGRLEIDGVACEQTAGLIVVPGGMFPVRCRDLGFFKLANMLVVIRACKLLSHEIIPLDNTNRPEDVSENCIYMIKCVCDTQCIGFCLETQECVDGFDMVLTDMETEPGGITVYSRPFTFDRSMTCNA